ncbi:ribosomal protein S18 [Gigaspora rosea]|uniref:Small ribosomal subunit protein bS18m n=1 Tax=Gigaspora rosea TaxID=44941 RepID=A0A397UQW4_9GLOM|nr:ribosomal protein S18 [Gigaspora rosea]
MSSNLFTSFSRTFKALPYHSQFALTTICIRGNYYRHYSSFPESSDNTDPKSNNSSDPDPHSKIMQILRESSAMNDPIQGYTQFKYGRMFRAGEVYAPHDLNEENYKDKNPRKYQKLQPNTDVFEKLGLDPLKEYKNFRLLSNFVSDMGRILPRRTTGLSAKTQRKLAKAIKRARSFGLIPATHRRSDEMDHVLFPTGSYKSKSFF